MNALPMDWSEQLQAVYPKRSGPSGWKGMRLMLALRRALFDSTWEQIIDGCKNYAKFCEEGGTAGSAFVQAPQRFIEDGSYLETFTFKAAEDPKITEHKRKEAERWERARANGARLNPPMGSYPLESVGAYETRIYLAQTQSGSGRAANSRGMAGSSGDASQIAGRVASLADRMRVAK